MGNTGYPNLNNWDSVLGFSRLRLAIPNTFQSLLGFGCHRQARPPSIMADMVVTVRRSRLSGRRDDCSSRSLARRQQVA